MGDKISWRVVLPRVKKTWVFQPYCTIVITVMITRVLLRLLIAAARAGQNMETVRSSVTAVRSQTEVLALPYSKNLCN